MSSREAIRLETVHAFLREHRDHILRTWEELVVAEVRRVELTRLALRDSIPAFLDELADWLETGAPPGGGALGGQSHEHVLDRLDQGFDLGQVLREYRLLREAILRVLLEAEQDEQDRAGPRGEGQRRSRILELARLNAGLDVALTDSIEEFVAERDRRAAADRKRADAERKRSEGELRASEARLQKALSAPTVGILFFRLDGTLQSANAAFERMSGYGSSELTRLPHWRTLTAPEFWDVTERTAVELAAKGEAPPYEKQLIRKDGSRWWGLFAPTRLSGSGLSSECMEFIIDIHARKQAEESLRSANETLREADRRKSEFLAVLSHELRNPLGPIRNGIYLLERAAPDSEQATRAREVVRRQSEHLTRLIDDLLDVTRISHGKIPLQRSRVDLREIVRKTTDDLYSVFDQAGIHLRVDTAGPMWIEADATRVAQVLTNLLHNATKFTARGGAVRVSAAARDGRAELRVVDDGIGMDPHAIEHMFEPFAQAEQSLARTKGGLGLGLALVKNIVELHGGTVTAHSEGVGRGSEFLVRLPLVTPGAAEQPRAADPGATALTVLVIEDNEDGAQSLADLLELHGHDVRVARDGRSGIALAREVHPDVILCDIGLPDVDGYEVARTLRHDGALRDARLVALSGYAQREDLQRARDAGFDAHIPKPPDVDELLSVVGGVRGADPVSRAT
ncbi:MAG TPA: ATP-binding protein [Anaeromyxobacter sp.]|nr:ATP-binding protein [Anaeromyxobacter sp.]